MEIFSCFIFISVVYEWDECDVNVCCSLVR